MKDIAITAEIAGRRVAREGVAFLPGTYLRRFFSSTDLDSFAAAWDGLGLDEYLPGRATYRRRQYGRLAAQPGPNRRYTLSPLQYAPFRQTADLIPLYQGKLRTFEPIEHAVLTSPALAILVNLDLTVITSLDGPRDGFIVGLHMIRITVEPGLGRFPAPEGRHADGHSYVAMHLIKRKACEGGRSRVFLLGDSEPILVSIHGVP